MPPTTTEFTVKLKDSNFPHGLVEITALDGKVHIISFGLEITVRIALVAIHAEKARQRVEEDLAKNGGRNLA